MFKNVPFYENTEDNTHCFQAAIRMVLKYFFPDEEYSFDQLDELTHKPKDKWTWPMAGLTFMTEHNLEVIHISDLDYARFGKEGRTYLKDFLPAKNMKMQEERSDLDLAQIDASEYSRSLVNRKNRPPKYTDLIQLVNDGYLLIAYVNRKHFVVVYHVTPESVELHNPGLPPEKSVTTTRNEFKLIWNGGQVMAFRKI